MANHSTSASVPPTFPGRHYPGQHRRTRPELVRNRALVVCAAGIVLAVAGWLYSASSPDPVTVTVPAGVYEVIR